MSAKTQTQGVPPRIVILREARNPLSLRVTNALVSPYPANSKSSRSLFNPEGNFPEQEPFLSIRRDELACLWDLIRK